MIIRRFVCTQATTHLKNPIKNNYTSTKWRIKQVTKSNFNQVLPEVKTHINNSDFIAISLQKTGLYSSPWQKVRNFDTKDIAYLKAKRSAENFQVFQFAICPFTLKGSNLTAFPFNFHLFPRDELKSGMPCYSFACQTSYLTSMARLGVDFNSCIYDGISYVSRAQEACVKPLTRNPLLRANAAQWTLGTSSVADSVFIERIKSRVGSWRSTCKDPKEVQADPLVNALQKVVLGNHQSRPSMDIDVCSERQAQLVLKVLKEFSDDIIPLLIPAQHGSTQGVRAVLTSSMEDRNLFEKELQDQEEEQNKRVRGFREVIDLISTSQKPIVAHNSLDELTFIHSKFLSPLPPTFEEFKGSIGSVFPYVIDMGHLMKEINPKGSTNNIPAASSYLRSRFLTPVTIDLPLQGTENEMNEGKVHGHNVLRLSHVFAKLYSVLKHNQHPVNDDNILALQKYVNTFNPSSSSPLENSDDDDKISSGGMRKFSCDNLMFLWGLGNELSVRELKVLLSGCHEAFSEDFDVRLVDKSCAIVATQQPGLTKAFLDAISSGGTDNDGLRKLISEGLRAANYETYRRVFDIEKWDYDLAECLDQVVMSTDQLPVNGRGSGNPYEILWDDDTVLNLDDV